MDFAWMVLTVGQLLAWVAGVGIAIFYALSAAVRWVTVGARTGGTRQAARRAGLMVVVSAAAVVVATVALLLWAAGSGFS